MIVPLKGNCEAVNKVGVKRQTLTNNEFFNSSIQKSNKNVPFIC